MITSTDRIEKHIELRAPRARVWRALTDAGEFGAWFRVALDGPFVVGARVGGQLTYPGYEHVRMEVEVERIEPEHTFAFRWHPHAIDPAVDYSAEPPTLVEFTLAEVAGGTRLTVVESGFDRVPAARRAEAFRMNEGGWVAQLDNVRAHVER
ncbi:MAG: SRPBCC family protein [Deltaproteobacteria bacterium]|nr:SRPBCC family protein [Deltaproteobacteria bacterium]